MAALGHVSAGLVAKRFAPKVPLFILLAAGYLMDILEIIFEFTGIDDTQYAPWTHSLVMSAIWSAFAGLLAALIFRSRRSGVVIALVVFSNWILDFITHPMDIGIIPHGLPFFLSASAKVGLGLYDSWVGMVIGEVGLPIVGLVFYLRGRRRAKIPLQD